MAATAHDPRANQKQRTRAAIVEAATKLVRGGGSPSVAEAAEAAKVSRATAYRYFPTPESLLIEVAGVTPAWVPVEELVAALKGDDAEGRLVPFVGKANSVTFAEEGQMRMALKVYLDTWFAVRGSGDEAPPLREGRRMRLLERVLEPIRSGMSKQQWRRLQAALSLTVGAEPMVIMKDVCRMDDAEAQEVLLWAAKALLEAGLRDAQVVNGSRGKQSGRSKTGN